MTQRIGGIIREFPEFCRCIGHRFTGCPTAKLTRSDEPAGYAGYRYPWFCTTCGTRYTEDEYRKL